uniref:Uncharacterized protein n=2 Tax=Globodera pallida TaxID=36090 RepID=A0A183BM09_GLOPA
MSRPKPFLHFKSSISGSIRALKSSSSPGRPSSLAYRFAATAPRKPGTSAHARQSQRGKSQERLQSKLQPQQQQQKQQQQQPVQQEESRSATAAEEEEEGTMVKMAASASRMAFGADARHAKAMSSRPAGDPTTEHLSRVAARARSTTAAAASVRRTQSAKSKRSVSRGSSSGGHSVKKEGGGTTTIHCF